MSPKSNEHHKLTQQLTSELTERNTRTEETGGVCDPVWRLERRRSFTSNHLESPSRGAGEGDGDRERARETGTERARDRERETEGQSERD